MAAQPHPPVTVHQQLEGHTVLKVGDLVLHPVRCKIADIALPQTGQDHHMVRLQTVLVP
jgi:hypothetical protein